MKKIKIIFITLTLLVAIAVCSTPFLSHLANCLGTNLMERTLLSAVMENDIEAVEVFTTHGHLEGNGNGMEYISCVLVKGNIESSHVVTSALSSKYEKCEAIIPKDGVFNVKYNRNDIKFCNEDFIVSNGEGYYMIYIFESISSDFCKKDFCGH